MFTQAVTGSTLPARTDCGNKWPVSFSLFWTLRKKSSAKDLLDWDKGKALLWLLEVMDSKSREIFPIYIGDDLTDEDAFHAIEQCGLGIIVIEGPRTTAAHFMLKNPGEVERFLRELTARLRLS